MKRLAFLMAVAAACSGQMCGSSNVPNDGGGNTNICDRQWFDSTYRVGWNPPTGTGSAQVSSFESADLSRKWSWPATTPPTEFSLMVLKPMAEKTLAEFRDAWLDTLRAGTEFTVLNEAYVTLSDGAQGWYLAISPNDKQGINSEFIMTTTQGRLVYVNAVYSADYVTDAQADEIGDALISLCADVN